MNNPVIYILINGELNMSPGKAAAQAVHASMTLGEKSKAEFSSQTKRTVIVLAAKNAEQIKNVEEYLSMSEIDSDYYIDEGVNEIDAYSVTALAAGPIAADDAETRSIFEAFPLYGGCVTVQHEDRFGFVGEKVIVPHYTKIPSKWTMNSIRNAVNERDEE